MEEAESFHREELPMLFPTGAPEAESGPGCRMVRRGGRAVTVCLSGLGSDLECKPKNLDKECELMGCSGLAIKDEGEGGPRGCHQVPQIPWSSRRIR